MALVAPDLKIEAWATHLMYVVADFAPVHLMEDPPHPTESSGRDGHHSKPTRLYL